jgi:hypothetical protein
MLSFSGSKPVISVPVLNFLRLRVWFSNPLLYKEGSLCRRGELYVISCLIDCHYFCVYNRLTKRVMLCKRRKILVQDRICKEVS